MPRDVYEAGASELRTTYALAAFLVFVVAFSLIPVVRLGHLNLETAPAWARAVVLIAALQLIYVAWMANAPDWTSLWVVMMVFALAATGYAVITAIALATPLHYPLVLGMAEVRNSAAKWCIAVLAVMCLATYLCGRVSTRWNRSFREGLGQRHRRRRRAAARW
jgi:hypothetical protein